MSVTRIEDMTMDTFPITELNRADYNVCKEMIFNPGFFRLVFFNLPSSEGLHLKYAITNYWKTSVDWTAVTVSEFINDLIAEIHKGSRPLDLSRYEDPAVLIVDDLQHLAGKEVTQEEFYNLVKRRLERKKLTIAFSEFGLEHLRIAMRDELVHLLTMGIQEGQ